MTIYQEVKLLFKISEIIFAFSEFQLILISRIFFLELFSKTRQTMSLPGILRKKFLSLFRSLTSFSFLITIFNILSLTSVTISSTKRERVSFLLSIVPLTTIGFPSFNEFLYFS